MHIDGTYLLPHFAFGCLAGLLRTAARALWPCILLHAVWNGWLVLAEFGWL
jgi:membrane protease YdiL (CAAX protease family)